MELSFDSLDTPALTKADIALLLFDQIGLNKRESKDFIDAFFELIVTELVAGRDVKISGLGNFEVRTKNARPGRNPRTGELVPISARRAITFKASNLLKDKINQITQ
jgi:integration host factor subunit alpha